MKRFKFIVSCAVVMALALTACDDTNFELVPTESTTETVVTTETDEAEVTPAISGTPSVTATPAPSGTTVTTTTVPGETETGETEANGSSGGENSGSGSPGGSDGGSGGGTSSGSSSGGSSSGSVESGGGSSSGGSGSNATSTPEPVETSVAKPTETTSSQYARKPCGSCGQQKLVDTPNYHYTTPEKTHEETTETWDYGIQHCTVQINWNSYAKELGDPPSIKISFDRKVDTSGKPYDNDAEKDATNQAIGKANEWLNGMGVSDYGHYYSYQTNSGSTDKINYNKTTTTVVDEPAHEYEVGAYVCDNCGAVTTYGTPKQIK